MSQNWGPEKKSVSQNWGPENKITLKYRDRKRKCIPKVGTGKEIGSQKWDQKDSFRSHLLRVKFFSGPHFWDKFSFPVPIFESNFLVRCPFLRYTFLIRSPILRHTLSLEFGEKSVFCPSFQTLGGKNPDTGYGFLTY